MQRLSGKSLGWIAALLSTSFSANAYARPKPKVVPNPALQAALSTTQTVYYASDNSQMFLAPDAKIADKLAQKFYLSFLALYTALQAMNRYQVLPTTAGADLIIRDDRAGFGVQILDGKTFQLIGIVKLNAISAFTEKKRAANIVKQLSDFAGGSKASKTLVLNPPPSLIAWTSQGIDSSAMTSRLQAVHSILIADQGTLPGVHTPAYQPGEMVAMLHTALTTWGHYQVVSNLADADLVTTFASNSDCFLSGTHEVRTGFTKDSVPDYTCGGHPTVGLTFLDAKTLLTIGTLSANQPDMTKRNGPDPKAATFKNIIDAWKKQVAPPTP